MSPSEASRTGRTGAVSVSRMLRPSEPDYLYALSKCDGADQTNGEPFGELGLVSQKDVAWGAQNGASRDPQPGNGIAREITHDSFEVSQRRCHPLKSGASGAIIATP